MAHAVEGDLSVGRTQEIHLGLAAERRDEPGGVVPPVRDQDYKWIDRFEGGGLVEPRKHVRRLTAAPSDDSRVSTLSVSLASRNWPKEYPIQLQERGDDAKA